MHDMEFAKYTSYIIEILEILEKSDKEKIENVVRNVVKFVIEENRNETNWLAHQLFIDVIPTENIIQIFDV